MIGYFVLSINIILLYFTLKNYFKFHKLSTTLLIIVLLSMAFKNISLLFDYKDSNSIFLKAGTSTMVLFSFSILISIIQAGTLSVKYTYLSFVRKTTWILSFVFLFAWFFLNQKDIITESIVVNYLLNNIIEFIIIAFVFVIGLYSYKDKKQWYLLAGSIGYFGLLVIFYLLGVKSIVSFSICQLVFITFLTLNEQKSIS